MLTKEEPMKKPLYPVFLLLGLLLSVQNVFAVFIVSPTQGHPNITVTLSDKVGDSSSTIGGITFGTVEITAAGHSLTAINGATIDGNDEVVTNLEGEYIVHLPFLQILLWRLVNTQLELVTTRIRTMIVNWMAVKTLMETGY